MLTAKCKLNVCSHKHHLIYLSISLSLGCSILHLCTSTMHMNTRIQKQTWFTHSQRETYTIHTTPTPFINIIYIYNISIYTYRFLQYKVNTAQTPFLLVKILEKNKLKMPSKMKENRFTLRWLSSMNRMWLCGWLNFP